MKLKPCTPRIDLLMKHMLRYKFLNSPREMHCNLEWRSWRWTWGTNKLLWACLYNGSGRRWRKLGREFRCIKLNFSSSVLKAIPLRTSKYTIKHEPAKQNYPKWTQNVITLSNISPYKLSRPPWHSEHKASIMTSIRTGFDCSLEIDTFQRYDSANESANSGKYFAYTVLHRKS